MAEFQVLMRVENLVKAMSAAVAEWILSSSSS